MPPEYYAPGTLCLWNTMFWEHYASGSLYPGNSMVPEHYASRTLIRFGIGFTN